jgi:hypothetical protein
MNTLSTSTDNVAQIERVSVGGTPEEPLLLVQRLTVPGAAARVAARHADDEHRLLECVRTMLDFAGAAMEHGSQAATIDAVETHVVQLTDRIDRATTADIPAAVSKLSETLAVEMAKVIGGGDGDGELQTRLNDLITKRLAETVAHISGENGPLGLLRAEFNQTAGRIATNQQEQMQQIATLLARFQAERELHQQELAAERMKQDAAALLAAAQAKGTQKGATYEETIDKHLHATCAPYEGEVEATHTVAGLIPGCKKGDWVVSFRDASVPRPVRVVVETKDKKLSPAAIRTELEEAAKNRDADAALIVLAGAELAPGGRLLHVSVATRQVLVVQGRDEQDALMLDIGVQLTRAIALQHAAMQAGAATDLDLSELGRLVHDIIEAIDRAKSTTTHTNAARKALDKIDAAYGELAARANAACAQLTSRLRAV